MKKLIILFVILLILTTNTCKTIHEKEFVTIKYILPPFPVREAIILPVQPELSDYAEIINYYEHLVQEWEAWGKNVEKILDTE